MAEVFIFGSAIFLSFKILTVGVLRTSNY